MICPFFGLFQWFRAKTTWETHPTGFLSPKKGDFGVLKKNSEKFWIIKKIFIDILETNSEKPKILFFWLRNPVGWVSHVVLALNQLK